MDSTVSNRSSPDVIRRNEIYHKFANLRKYKNFNSGELKLLLSRQRNVLFFLDVICFLSNLTVVTWLYFNHFKYVDNNYEMNDEINTDRLICLGLAVLSCLAIVARAINKRIFKNLEFILGLRSKGIISF
jgi:hypothetical protein